MLGRRWYVAASLVALVAATSGSADALTRAERIMRDFERDLCRSLSFAKCKRKIAKRKRTAAPRRKAAPAKAKVKPAKEIVEPKAKPDKPRGKVNPPEKVAKPEPKPENPFVAAPKPEVPLPPDKPVTVKPPPLVEKPPEPPAVPPAAVPPPADTAVGSVCRLRLDTLGVAFETVPDTVASGECRVEHPVRLKSLKAGETAIEFPDGPILRCEFAVKFVEWLRDAGAPIVRAQTNSSIARLWTGPGYQCRGRNGDASAKTSEHGFGNAVDITNFKLADGRMFEVKDALSPASPAYAVLKGLRGSACGYFTTVLGPGSNEAHKEHFHFDLGKHGRSDNYKICE